MLPRDASAVRANEGTDAFAKTTLARTRLVGVAWQPWLWGSMLTITTLIAFTLSDTRERATRRAERVREANDALDLWRLRHEQAVDALDSLDGLFYSSETVEESEFERFAAHLGGRFSGRRAFAWYQRDETSDGDEQWTLRFAWPREWFAPLPTELDAGSSTELTLLERAFADNSLVAGVPGDAGHTSTPHGLHQPILLCRGHDEGVARPVRGAVVTWIDGAGTDQVRPHSGVRVAYFDESPDGDTTRLVDGVPSTGSLALDRSLASLREDALLVESFEFADRRRTAVSLRSEETFPASSLGSYLLLAFGAIATIVGVQWQRTLVRRELEIQHEVIERTRELQAANEELDSFSYSVSHDLRAPLRALSGFSRVLDEDHGAELSPDARRAAQAIARNAERMGRLLDDLLRLSRASRQPLRCEAVELDALVERVWSQLAPERAAREITFQCAKLPIVTADRGLLEQVFVNLLSNAVKFTRPRERAEIAVECELGPTLVTLRVRDNGVGFDMRFASQLFGVFQRLHRPEEFEGTGVGLALSRRILARHGGNLSAHSQLGHGTTFTLTLSRALAP